MKEEGCHIKRSFTSGFVSCFVCVGTFAGGGGHWRRIIRCGGRGIKGIVVLSGPRKSHPIRNQRIRTVQAVLNHARSFSPSLIPTTHTRSNLRCQRQLWVPTSGRVPRRHGQCHLAGDTQYPRGCLQQLQQCNNRTTRHRLQKLWPHRVVYQQ